MLGDVGKSPSTWWAFVPYSYGGDQRVVDGPACSSKSQVHIAPSCSVWFAWRTRHRVRAKRLRKATGGGGRPPLDTCLKRTRRHSYLSLADRSVGQRPGKRHRFILRPDKGECFKAGKVNADGILFNERQKKHFVIAVKSVVVDKERMLL